MLAAWPTVGAVDRYEERRVDGRPRQRERRGGGECGEARGTRRVEGCMPWWRRGGGGMVSAGRGA